MGKPFQLLINDPCHEQWDSMSMAEQGRFCSSCQKQVVDFTMMSDSQLAEFFKRPSAASVCGRFYNDQLNRDLVAPKKAIPWMKYFFQVAIPAFLLSAKGSAQKLKSAIKTPGIVQATQAVVLGEYVLVSQEIVPEQKISVKGWVVDADNNGVPFASIMIKGTKNGIMADSAGYFLINEWLATGDIVLQTSSVGYLPKEVMIKRDREVNDDLLIQLDRLVLDGVVISSGIHRTMSMMMGGITVVRNLSDRPVQQVPEVKPAMIKVYPNPVISGTTINIGCEKLEEGYYSFQLFTLAGQSIQTKQVWIDAEARIMNMEIPTMSAGIYILTLIHRDSRKRFSEQITVQ